MVILIMVDYLRATLEGDGNIPFFTDTFKRSDRYFGADR